MCNANEYEHFFWRFYIFCRSLKRKLDIDYVYANQLDFENGKLTGRVKGGIVDGQMKVKLLLQLAAEEGICPEQVIVVGDGANDLLMLSIDRELLMADPGARHGMVKR
jgi:phosphoserine phosphatase